jgi:hypothetical protein
VRFFGLFNFRLFRQHRPKGDMGHFLNRIVGGWPAASLGVNLGYSV